MLEDKIILETAIVGLGWWGRKIVELDARMLDPLDDLEPLRPIRVD